MMFLIGQFSPASCHSQIFSSAPGSPTSSNRRAQVLEKYKATVKNFGFV
jgi:hypothetical protein